MRIAIGADNFYKMVTDKVALVDKTLFIKDVIDDDSQVTLITRPRRWGKTLNLHMLECFFSATVSNYSTVKN